jgi:hypothetical protein
MCGRRQLQRRGVWFKPVGLLSNVRHHLIKTVGTARIAWLVGQRLGERKDNVRFSAAGSKRKVICKKINFVCLSVYLYLQTLRVG